MLIRTLHCRTQRGHDLVARIHACNDGAMLVEPVIDGVTQEAFLLTDQSEIDQLAEAIDDLGEELDAMSVDWVPGNPYPRFTAPVHAPEV